MKSHLGIIAGAFLLSGALAVLVVVVTRAREEPSVQLADGTTFTLKSVTFGREHSFGGPSWPKRLARAAARFMGRSGGTTSPPDYKTTNDSIVCWLIEDRSEGAGRDVYREFRLVDQQRRTSASSSWTTRRNLNKAQTLHGIGFESFPRRDDGFLLWLMKPYDERDRETPAAELPVRNPGPRRFPAWTAGPPPVATRGGDLEFTLVRCVLGEIDPRQRRRQAGQTPTETRTLLSFRVTETNQLTTDWQPVGVESWDATGNRAVNRSWSTSTKNNEVEFRYRDTLWPDEPAWKLRVEFARAQNFPPDELWIPGEFAVAENTRKIDPDNATPIASTNRLGVTVGILGIDPSSGPNQDARLKVRMKPVVESVRLTLVRITDETGRSIKLGGSGWSGDGSKRDYEYNLRDLDEAKSLRVTFALHRGRYAEFLVQPETAW